MKSKEWITIRDAVPTDVAPLAELHVHAWNATYPRQRARPTLEVRERQWRRTFARDDGNWFCYVIENDAGALAGFVKGSTYDHPALPAFGGELSKIYLLEPYKGRGLGRHMVGLTARRFLGMGIESMLLFAEKRSPACGFFERLGAERLLDDAGRFRGGFGFRDLRRLAADCPADRDLIGARLDHPLPPRSDAGP